MVNEAEASKDSTAVAGNGTVTRDHPVIINNYLGEKETRREKEVVLERDPPGESNPQTKAANTIYVKVALVVSILGNVIFLVITVVLLRIYLPVLQRVWQLQDRNQQLLDTCEGSAKVSYAVVKEILNGGYQ